MEKILKSAIFTSLKKQQIYLKDETITSLFKLEDNRFKNFNVENQLASFNFSNVLIDEKTFSSLKKLLVSRKVNDFFTEYFNLENKFSYHFLYRTLSEDKYKLNGKYVNNNIEKFYDNIEDVFTKTKSSFYSDFIVIADEYNCNQLDYLFNLISDSFLVGKKIHFVKNKDELNKVLNSVFIEQTYFFFADINLKNEIFKEMFDLLNNKFTDINNQACFICQNIKFAEIFKADNIVNYSSLVNFSYDYFVQFTCIARFIIGKENLNLFLSGFREADLDLKDNFINSFSVNFACVLLYQFLFNNNLLLFNNNLELKNINLYFSALLDNLRGENSDFNHGIFIKNSSNIFSDKDILEVLFYFKKENNEQFLNNIAYLNKNNFSFLTFIAADFNLKNLAFILGILENTSLILKILFDENLDQEKEIKKSDVTNKSVFIKNMQETLS